MDSLFPESYEASRARFIRDFELLRPKWADSRLESIPLKTDSSLSIDYAWAEPRKKEKLIIITTAEHGIEGYVGSAMLKIFMDEFAPRLNPENTGLLLVHAINPWGMKNNRKVNENSVDLNRNFVYGKFDTEINPDFKTLGYLFTPQRPARSFFMENLSFWGRIIRAIVTSGISRVSTAALLGQHHTPKGFYYGGSRHEDVTQITMGLYRKALEEYDTVIQMDMHTGYGPRDQMSIIIPPVDPISSKEAVEKFNYPLVQKINPEEFYAINGDMGEYYYLLRNESFPQKKIFVCGFEFGTFGDSLLARIRSLRAMIFENQLNWHGAVNEKSARVIRQEFSELYFPAEDKWREKAASDCRRAFEGILAAYNISTKMS
ncbi:MAG: DUF2817 domain-containing protein [Chloroflexi bacterium]|nr:DUF2817 domain-containing protein [Chloroflexota bacterium]